MIENGGQNGVFLFTAYVLERKKRDKYVILSRK